MQTAYLDPLKVSLTYQNETAGGASVSQYREEVLARETAYLLAGDQQVHRETRECIESFGVRVVGFFDAEAYVSYPRNDSAGCLVVDMELCGISVLQVQRRLVPGLHPPVVFLSEKRDIRSTVSAMKSGAVDVLTRPVDPQALLVSIRMGFQQDARRRQKEREQAKLQRRLSCLTPREREVLPLVIGGLLNKQSAALLDISEVTLQIHRSQIMRKMEADSLPDLVRMALKLRIQHWREN